jgi:aerobic carbon-monoxide dehydrogenase medium subunit
VFVAKTAGGVRVAVTGAGSCAFRVKALEDQAEREVRAGVLRRRDDSRPTA